MTQDMPPWMLATLMLEARVAVNQTSSHANSGPSSKNEKYIV